MPVDGFCKLCGQQGELVEGHIWPKWVYKRYVSDTAHGGSFIDLMNQERTNRQLTEHLFCKQCDGQVIGGSESYARPLFVRFDEGSETDVHPYDSRFLQFAVSISYRVGLFNLYAEHPTAPELLRPACRCWKEYLLGSRRSIEPYSQHAFLVYDRTVGMHRGLGGIVNPKERFIFCQIGPLFLFALLDRSHLTLRDLRTWDATVISSTSSTITPITKFEGNKNITAACAKVLMSWERWAKGTMMTMPVRHS